MLDPELLAQIDAQAADLPTLTPLAALDLRELAAHQFKQREPLLTPWLHSQDLAMIFAGRGIGKTHLAMAISYGLGDPKAMVKTAAEQGSRLIFRPVYNRAME